MAQPLRSIGPISVTSKPARAWDKVAQTYAVDGVVHRKGTDIVGGIDSRAVRRIMERSQRTPRCW